MNGDEDSEISKAQIMNSLEPRMTQMHFGFILTMSHMGTLERITT